MSVEIKELWGRGIHGSPAMGHIVSIGAHDGHGRGMPPMRKVSPNRLAQYKSWFAPAGPYSHDGHPVIAQIFFPFGDARIDNTTDKVVLDAVIAHARFELSQRKRVELEFVGHADPVGAASFNSKLALKRAQQVRDYVDRRISNNAVERIEHLRYRSMVTSHGESDPTGDNKADRRVDVVLRSENVRHYISFGDQPLVIPGEYTGPLTRKLQFRGWGGVSVSLFKIIGGETVEIEIRNPQTGKSAFYSYVGLNVGTPSPIPIGASPPDSGYTNKEIPIEFGYVDIEDFAGPGAIGNAAIVKGGSILIFSGPKLHHTKKILRQNGWEVFLDGWSISFPGASAGGGNWRRQPYSNAQERAAFLSRAPNRPRDDFGPKY
jgi:outer membrane protein OmpA-like peptidoglycan-associated protein